eukprot:663138-Pyramimonas_sp.AAC.1
MASCSKSMMFAITGRPRMKPRCCAHMCGARSGPHRHRKALATTRLSALVIVKGRVSSAV